MWLPTILYPLHIHQRIVKLCGSFSGSFRTEDYTMYHSGGDEHERRVGISLNKQWQILLLDSGRYQIE